MAKIRVEVEVPSGEYCDTMDNICPMCIQHGWGGNRCVLFRNELETDENNLCSIRCDKCKQAEVNDEDKS